MFDRFAARLSYVAGDFADAATYGRVADAIKGAEQPVFYLEIPPFLFGTVVAGLSEAGLTDRRPGGRREAVRPRPGVGAGARRRAATSTSTSRRSTGSTTSSGRWASRSSSTSGSPTRCSSRSGTATTSTCVQITMAESFGVEDRGHFYDPVGALRDVVVNHLMQVVVGDGDGGPRRRRPRDAQGRAARRRSAPSATADPAHYVRGQYDGYLDTDGVAADSTTETYAALRLDIDNWRWSGVPFFIRTGKHLPATQTEVRLVFKRPPQLGFGLTGDRPPEPDQLVVKLDPTTGIRLLLDARRARRRGPETITLDMEFAEQGGEGATPYEVLLHAAMVGQSTPLHPPGRRRGDVADHAAAARRAAPGPPATPRGRGGPTAADDLVAGHGRLARRRGWRHELPSRPRLRAQSAAMPSPFPPIEDYAFLSDCHTGALVAPDGARRLAVRAALRRAQRVRHPARPPGRATSASGRSASTSRRPGPTSPAPTSWPRPGTRRAAGSSSATR